MPNFQILQFGLNFRSYHIDCLGLAFRVFEGHPIVLRVDTGDLQLHLYLTVSFATRIVAARRGADFTGTFGAAWQALVDIGVEVSRDRSGHLDVNQVAGFQLA
ncbi:hypothetical protein D3C73_1462320 [compost metagenome]